MTFFRVQEENHCLKIKVAHLVKALEKQENRTVERQEFNALAHASNLLKNAFVYMIYVLFLPKSSFFFFSFGKYN